MTKLRVFDVDLYDLSKPEMRSPLEDAERKILFRAEGHEYYEEGRPEVKFTSVSQFLLQRGVTQPYPDIPAVRAAAAKGTLIHKQIETALNDNKLRADGFKTMPKETELYHDYTVAFIEAIRDRLVDPIIDFSLQTERIVWHDELAGTLDLFYQDKNGKNTILDIKTARQPNKEACCAQLLIYAYLWNRLAPIWYPHQNLSADTIVMASFETNPETYKLECVLSKFNIELGFHHEGHTFAFSTICSANSAMRQLGIAISVPAKKCKRGDNG